MQKLKLITLSLIILLCSCTTVSFDQMIGEKLDDKGNQLIDKFVGEWELENVAKIKLKKIKGEMDYEISITGIRDKKNYVYTASPRLIKGDFKDYLVLWCKSKDTKGYIPIRLISNIHTKDFLCLAYTNSFFFKSFDNVIEAKSVGSNYSESHYYVRSSFFIQNKNDNNLWNLGQTINLIRRKE